MLSCFQRASQHSARVASLAGTVRRQLSVRKQPMIQVAELRSLEQLETFRVVWRNLLHSGLSPSFSSSREWLECYAKAFGPSIKLRVLAVYVANRPIGIVPLVIKRVATRLGSVRVLTTPNDDWAPLWSVVGRNPAATLYGLLRHLKSTPRDWDVLELRDVGSDESDRSRIQNAFTLAGLSAVVRPWQSLGVISPKAWAPARVAAEQQRAEAAGARLSARLGTPVTWVRHRPDGRGLGDTELQRRLFLECQPLWNQGDENSNWFLRETYLAAALSAMVDLNVAMAGDRPIGVAWSYCDHGRLELTAANTDPALGTDVRDFLWSSMLADSARRRDEEILVTERWQTVAEPFIESRRETYRYSYYASSSPRIQLLGWNAWRAKARTPQPGLAVDAETAAASETIESPASLSVASVGRVDNAQMESARASRRRKRFRLQNHQSGADVIPFRAADDSSCE